MSTSPVSDRAGTSLDYHPGAPRRPVPYRASAAIDVEVHGMAQGSCLFCRIAAGEIPADVVHQDADVVAFRDIAPQAPTHVLLIPRRHIASALDLTEEDAPLVGALLGTASRIARQEGIAEDGYRVVTNVGRDGGQSVEHLHFHLMGGRRFAWPPG